MSAIPAWARKGAEVVCIRDFSQSRTVHDKGYRALPTLRQSYVIDMVEEWPAYGAVVLILVGLPPIGYDIIGFAPATKRTADQDIAEHFSHHLTAPQGVTA